MFKFATRGAALALSAVLMAGAATVAGCATPSATAALPDRPGASQIVAMRRLTESQYRHIVADIFGDDIVVRGRFEPERRSHGLFAIGAQETAISSLGFQQYFAMGRSIADQVLAEDRRATSVPCQPADATKADDACAEAFIRRYGSNLFRRPITDAEVAARVELARTGAADGDFYAGLKLALASLLTAPEYLFRYESAVRRGREWTLDNYTRASRLSFLYWDTAPDAELLDAAARGELLTDEGLARQVARLEASPKLEQGLRAFIADMFQFEKLDERPKNTDIYPKFSQALADSAREQVQRTVVNHLLRDEGDYRDLLITRETEINRTIASVYRIPYTFNADWIPYTFKDDEGRAGVQSLILFLAQFSHPGRSSPTLRGVGLNEVLLCEETPTPPDNVDFDIVNDVGNPLLKTVRARLLAHAVDETCAGCHNLTDPIGLSLEHFDGLGQPRHYENGELIDVSAEIDGVPFTGAPGLAQVLRENDRVPACFVKMIFSYGVGRAPTVAEEFQGFLPAQTEAFKADGYRYKPLMRRIATAPEFYTAALPARENLRNNATVAALSERPNSRTVNNSRIGGL